MQTVAEGFGSDPALAASSIRYSKPGHRDTPRQFVLLPFHRPPDPAILPFHSECGDPERADDLYEWNSAWPQLRTHGKVQRSLCDCLHSHCCPGSECLRSWIPSSP